MNDALECEGCGDPLPLGLAMLLPHDSEPGKNKRVCRGCFDDGMKRAADDGRTWLGV